MDISIGGRQGKSDPYVTLTVKGAKETHYKKSSIQKKTLNPTWNDAFEFSEIYDADTEVVILEKDDNAVGKIGTVRGKSPPLGQAATPPSAPSPTVK